ncbi:MAG: VWA containing CoxE family protein [Cereibacter sphaeroides]|uniref:VWA containing CoxE family protein n=1 Tax=Cereibacter sphaeroides TaxID=1063 RepID=A0A2W5SAZ7_CERSP|nr:MAG: VWA containing CoxE family protein [Cereibacter sphaeroides]
MRATGFRVAPEQGIGFMHAVALLGPRSMEDIRQAALATLSPQPDRRVEFEALFQSYFWGDAGLIGAASEDEETPVKDDAPQTELPAAEPEEATGGEIAAGEHRKGMRDFDSDDDRLEHFARALSHALPVRQSFRSIRAPSHGKPDLRRSLRVIVKADGDVPDLLMRKRRSVQRKLLLLIDISGSMRMHTEEYLKVAHAAVQGAPQTEVFTFGTGLTRITTALRIRDRGRALEQASKLVDDWDGGTRIGSALLAFLSVPRFAAFARGAAILLLTDGLERGSPVEMELAFRRLSSRAYRLSLCTPLAADPRYRPRTAALSSVLSLLDDLVSGASIPELTQFILSLARPARPARDIWREAA